MPDAVGSEPRRFTLRGFDPDAQETREFEFRGELLGESTSHRSTHARLIHDPGSYAAPGDRCSACRWFEVRIYEMDEPNERSYVVETVGMTTVPGEVERRRVRIMTEPRRIISTLVQDRDGETFIPETSRRVLEQAAQRDPAIAEVVSTLLAY